MAATGEQAPQEMHWGWVEERALIIVIVSIVAIVVIIISVVIVANILVSGMAPSTPIAPLKNQCGAVQLRAADEGLRTRMPCFSLFGFDQETPKHREDHKGAIREPGIAKRRNSTRGRLHPLGPSPTQTALSVATRLGKNLAEVSGFCVLGQGL